MFGATMQAGQRSWFWCGMAKVEQVQNTLPPRQEAGLTCDRHEDAKQRSSAGDAEEVVRNDGCDRHHQRLNLHSVHETSPMPQHTAPRTLHARGSPPVTHGPINQG